jgi:hypothetical protein
MRQALRRTLLTFTVGGAVLSLLITAGCLFAYERWVRAPATLRLGLVDVAAIVGAKRATFIETLSQGSAKKEEIGETLTKANRFGAQLDKLLREELPGVCQCVVLDKAAVAGAPLAIQDWTPWVKARIGL